MSSHDQFRGWHKARASGNGNGCVEVAIKGDGSGAIGVRDTKQNRRGPVLEYRQDSWRSFVADVRDGKIHR